MTTEALANEYQMVARELVNEKIKWYVTINHDTHDLSGEPTFHIPEASDDVPGAYTVGEFIMGTMIWHMDSSLPSYNRNQQLLALACAVRAEVDLQGTETLLGLFESQVSRFDHPTAYARSSR